MNTLLGFTGTPGRQKQVGKDAWASYLAKHYGFGTMMFAGILKQMLAVMLDEDLSLYESDRTKNEVVLDFGDKQYSRRQLAQLLGTDWGRCIIHPDIWVLATERKLENFWKEHPGKSMVFTDVRFDNEADLIHRHGGLVVSISRDTGIVDSHASEKGVSENRIDFKVTNDYSSVEEFTQESTIKLGEFLAQ